MLSSRTRKSVVPTGKLRTGQVLYAVFDVVSLHEVLKGLRAYIEEHPSEMKAKGQQPNRGPRPRKQVLLLKPLLTSKASPACLPQPDFVCSDYSGPLRHWFSESEFRNEFS